jgi:hypothetical protein
MATVANLQERGRDYSKNPPPYALCEMAYCLRIDVIERGAPDAFRKQGGEHTETSNVVKFSFGPLVDGIAVRFGDFEPKSLSGTLGRFDTRFWDRHLLPLSPFIA